MKKIKHGNFKICKKGDKRAYYFSTYEKILCICINRPGEEA